MKTGRIVAAFALTAGLAAAQGLVPEKLLDQPTDAWPTYNGDYSGRRFSPLTQINASNVAGLQLAWSYQLQPGLEKDAVVGGIGNLDASGSTGARIIKSSPIIVDGVLYLSTSDNAWALDAKTGQKLWHYVWKSRGGIHIGNRGMGMYRDWLFFEVPDNYLVSLNAKDGTERWHVEIANVNQEYFSTPAPVIVGNHVIVGTGGDSLDMPGFLESRDPETGERQWRWNSTPRAGDPGSETWPDPDAAAHGGGMTWVPGTYDPQLNLYYLGVGNPQPVLAGHRRQGSNLYTGSIVALNPDTGKLQWWFQASPHDTHDWDNTTTPVLIDGEVDGQPRKLLAQAARNGYFFLLDRQTGKNIYSKPYIKINWSLGLDEKGQPIPDPAKEPSTDGTLVVPSSNGGTNWWAPSFNPATGMFYANTNEVYSIFYLTDTSDRPQGWGGRDVGLHGTSALKAIDYKTGEVVRSHEYPQANSNSGILTTAGGVLFTGDPSKNVVAFDPSNGDVLWHDKLESPVSNGPVTVEVDGKQYVFVGAGDTLYAYTLPN